MKISLAQTAANVAVVAVAAVPQCGVNMLRQPAAAPTNPSQQQPLCAAMLQVAERVQRGLYEELKLGDQLESERRRISKIHDGHAVERIVLSCTTVSDLSCTRRCAVQLVPATSDAHASVPFMTGCINDQTV